MWHILLCLGLVTLVAGQSLHFKPHGVASVTSILCPDKQGTCPSLSTCCLLTSGKYGCCPMQEATCCSDHLHCCPHGFKCNLLESTCTHGNKTTPMVTKYLANQVADSNDVVCPGGKMYCPGSTTCCRLTTGQWGCCPLFKATCCEDGVHCCPTGYKCNKKRNTCDKGGNTNSWFQLTQATGRDPTPTKKVSTSDKQAVPSGVQMTKPVVQNKKNICPGGQTQCDGGNTCCFKDKWHFRCCPYINGICCHGGEHCCPLGFSCDIKLGKCTKGGSLHLPWGETYESKKSHEPEPEDLNAPESVICPGGGFTCPDGSTCCALSSTQYGCCPLAKAVCCSDHLHCCPAGSVCDTQSETCKQAHDTVPWTLKTAAKTRKLGENKIVSLEGDSVKCPGGEASCPDDSTCCMLLSGKYGCCPLKKAVCCSDHLHCCPEGAVCDVEAQTCKQGDNSIPWSTKIPATPRIHRASRECADNKTTCADSTTCCPMLDGYYACCPFENANCCPDKLHCCPSNQVCDAQKGECVTPKLHSVDTYQELVASRVAGAEGVICPDKKTCPSGSTCCQISSGLYGCCPSPNAVCCSDHAHCCPEGHTCDVAAGKCTANGDAMPWLTKTAAQPLTAFGTNKPIRLEKVMCPDQESFCPDQTTCCLLKIGQYGCCPLPNANCCPDGVHCCPSGYKCDSEKTSCVKSTDSIPWVEKFPAQPVRGGDTWVVCPDKTSQCPDGQTCCKLPSAKYGCCPLPKAVCCSDGLHCCPTGSTCDVAHGTCSSTSNSLTISWTLVHQPTVYVKTVTDQVTCNDKTICPTGSTCCMMTSGKYGCCPYTKGSCCADQIHCCPDGFHCDKSGRRCDSVDSSITLTSTMFTRFKPAPPREESDDVTIVKCPGGKDECPDGSTCCKQPSGLYGCCKFDNAVCCSDGVHCCPQGFACDPQSGTCTQSISWLAKIPATPIPALYNTNPSSNAVVCPDRKHQCPEHDTCCMLKSGEWGCCTLPQAVCCADGEHCCPHGYHCLEEEGRCAEEYNTQNNIPLPFLAIVTKAETPDL